MFLQVLTALCYLFPFFTLVSFIITAIINNILYCYLDQTFLYLKAIENLC